MPTLTPLSFALPPVACLADEARLLLKSARMWVMLARNHRNPRPVIDGLMGASTARFCLLMDSIASAWADPFTTFPPCSATLSPDEYLLLGLLSRADCDDEQGFHQISADLLPLTERQRLWRVAQKLMADRIGTR